MPKVEGYSGICGVCFEPIKTGQEVKFRKNGSLFHDDCTKKNPNSYYLALEKIRGKFENGEDPTELMNEMERIFKIPGLNNNKYNEDNIEVVKLYKEISISRDL